ncbi:unnamed protein product [Nezara viridula]|uniref:Uncharacterized protein n=1 Tax=Nezara viridula TaxID=85310 RepID=A0A9P0HCE9_NEZVI|nr:unnamed protein product [Nezara viridula]
MRITNESRRDSRYHYHATNGERPSRPRRFKLVIQKSLLSATPRLVLFASFLAVNGIEPRVSDPRQSRWIYL